MMSLLIHRWLSSDEGLVFVRLQEQPINSRQQIKMTLVSQHYRAEPLPESITGHLVQMPGTKNPKLIEI